MKMLVKKVAIACLVAWLAGCAGTNFKWDDARQLKPGMTKQEVTALLGSPSTIRTAGEGEQKWVWVYVSTFTGSKSLAVTFKDGLLVKAPEIPENF